jgi:hypothetical protein
MYGYTHILAIFCCKYRYEVNELIIRFEYHHNVKDFRVATTNIVLIQQTVLILVTIQYGKELK